MVGLYKILSPSGKVYIGQSINIKRRWNDHRAKSRQHRQPKLFNSIQKHGYDNHLFSIIHELPSDIDVNYMNMLEHLYIEQYKSCGVDLLNLTGGGGSFGSHSEESKEKLRKAHKGREPWNKGKTGCYTDEARKNISNSLKGRKISQKMRDVLLKNVIGNKNRLGKKHSDETKIKISKTKEGNSPAWNKGKPWSDEVKDKMHKFPKGHTPFNKGKEHKFHTEESRKKLSEAHLKAWAYRKENNITISIKGEECPHAKLNEQKVLEIREKLLNGQSTRTLSSEYGVAQSSINNIAWRKTWKHI